MRFLEFYMHLRRRPRRVAPEPLGSLETVLERSCRGQQANARLYLVVISNEFRKWTPKSVTNRVFLRHCPETCQKRVCFWYPVFQKHVFCDSKFLKLRFYEAFPWVLYAPARASSESRTGTIGILRDCPGVKLQRPASERRRAYI